MAKPDRKGHRAIPAVLRVPKASRGHKANKVLPARRAIPVHKVCRAIPDRRGHRASKVLPVNPAARPVHKANKVLPARKVSRGHKARKAAKAIRAYKASKVRPEKSPPNNSQTPSAAPRTTRRASAHSAVRSPNYKDVRVIKVEPDGIVLIHTTLTRVGADGKVLIDSEGVAKIKFVNLPISWQRFYGYDLTVATQYEAQQNERNAQNQARIAGVGTKRYEEQVQEALDERRRLRNTLPKEIQDLIKEVDGLHARPPTINDPGIFVKEERSPSVIKTYFRRDALEAARISHKAKIEMLATQLVEKRKLLETVSKPATTADLVAIGIATTPTPVDASRQGTAVAMPQSGGPTTAHSNPGPAEGTATAIRFDGLYVRELETVPSPTENWIEMYRFYQDGTVIHSRAYVPVGPLENAVLKVVKWFHRNMLSVTKGQWTINGSKIKLTISISRRNQGQKESHEAFVLENNLIMNSDSSSPMGKSRLNKPPNEAGSIAFQFVQIRQMP